MIFEAVWFERGPTPLQQSSWVEKRVMADAQATDISGRSGVLSDCSIYIYIYGEIVPGAKADIKSGGLSSLVADKIDTPRRSLGIRGSGKHYYDVTSRTGQGGILMA